MSTWIARGIRSAYNTPGLGPNGKSNFLVGTTDGENRNAGT